MTAIPAKVKKAVFERDGGQCVRCWGTAHDCHHRVVRGMGGTSDDKVNYGMAGLISVCRKCHDEIHAEPEMSYATGFLVHSWDDPAEIPIRIGKDYGFFLTEEGKLDGVTMQYLLF